MWRSDDNSGCCSSDTVHFHWRQGLSLAWHFASHTMLASKALGTPASIAYPSTAGITSISHCFTWVLETQSQVFMLTKQALCHLNQRPNLLKLKFYGQRIHYLSYHTIPYPIPILGILYLSVCLSLYLYPKVLNFRSF